MCKLAGICLLEVQNLNSFNTEERDLFINNNNNNINNIPPIDNVVISETSKVLMNGQSNLQQQQQQQREKEALKWWYFKQAISVYLWIYKLIETHRQPLPLLAIVKVHLNQVSEIIFNNISSSSDRSVSSSLDTMAASPVMELNTPNSENMTIGWISQLNTFTSSSSSSTITNIANITTSTMKNMKTGSGKTSDILSLTTSLHSTFQFHSKRQIISLQIDPLTSLSQIQSYIKMNNLNDCNLFNINYLSASNNSSNTNINSNTNNNANNANNEINEVFAIYFPYEIVLSVISSSGSLETSTDILTMYAPLPSCNNDNSYNNNNHASASMDISTVPTSVEKTHDYIMEGNHRSRTWKLTIKSIHTQCITVTRQCNTINITNNEEFQLLWSSLYNITVESPPQQALKKVFIGMNVKMFESSLDVDNFQELHLCRNLCSILSAQEFDTFFPYNNNNNIDMVKLARELEKTRVRVFTTTPPPTTTGSIINDIVTDDLYLSVANTANKTTSTITTTKPTTTQSSSTTNTATIYQSLHTETNQAFITQFKNRADTIEREFVSTAQARYISATYKFQEILSKVSEIDQEILSCIHQISDTHINNEVTATVSTTNNNSNNRLWWNNILPEICQNNTFLCNFQTHIDFAGEAYIKFKQFRQASGLSYILGQEYSNLIQCRMKSMNSLLKLPKIPSQNEIDEGSNCSNCRAYFHKTGPICRHCKLKEVIKSYERCLQSYKSMTKNIHSKSNTSKTSKNNKNKNKNSSSSYSSQTISIHNNHHNTINNDDYNEVDIVITEHEKVDGCLLMFIKQLRVYIMKYNVMDYIEICQLELKYFSLLELELTAMYSVWNRYLELLKLHDELLMVRL